MKRRAVIGAVLVAVLALGASTYALATPGAGAAGNPPSQGGISQMNISVTGQKQGDFTPGKTIRLLTLTHEIVSPRDPQSGLPTGRRQHKPLSVTMQWGPTTPKFLAALIDNENLTSVLIGLLRPDGKLGATIKLTNANVSHYVETSGNAQVDFTYQKIEWTWVDTGITAQDDWAASQTTPRH